MKVKVVCQRDSETKFINIPMDEKGLLSIQGSVLDRDTIGYVAGAEATYYDEQGNEIEIIFILNKQLKNQI